MEIDINQKKISIGDKYKIFIDGQEQYKAARKLFRLLAVVELYIGDNDTPRMTIRKRWGWFRAKYDIVRADNVVLPFRTKSFWKDYYQCVVGVDTYELYGHRGRKFSIYKNGKQIAWWEQRAVAWFAGDNYKITADNDADAELLISLCLIIDNYSSDKHDGTAFNYHIGKIGPQEKKFDEGWMPKRS